MATAPPPATTPKKPSPFPPSVHAKPPPPRQQPPPPPSSDKDEEEGTGHVSGVASPPQDEELIKKLEFKLATVEKQLRRLEDMISRGVPKRSKTMVINYDLGRDKNVDTRDIAWGAFGFFGVLGMILGKSIAHNMWLICGFAMGSGAAWLCREEEGGALSDVIREVGYQMASKAREFLFLWRTGRLSYMYFQRWEALDKKYRLMDKWEVLVAASSENVRRAQKFEKKHEIGNKVMGFVMNSIGATFDVVGKVATKLSNKKDRREMVRKLPTPFYRLFTTKAQRDAEKKYIVKLFGQSLCVVAVEAAK